LTSGGHLSYVYIGANVPTNSSAAILYENSTDHADKGTNILFGDGSVKWYNTADAQAVIHAPVAP
jgi:prepilin-type processing-associated H-X9-DG protein